MSALRKSAPLHFFCQLASCAALLLLSACAGLGASASLASQHAAASQGRPPVPFALSTAMQTVARGLARVGLRPASEGHSGFLPSNQRATFPVTVPAGTCVTLVAVATKNIQDVDAALYTPEGELLAVDAELNAHPTIQTCAAEADRTLYYVLQLYDGDGSYFVQPFYGPRASLTAAARLLGGRPAFAEAVRSRELVEDPEASLTEGLRKRGYQEAQDALVISVAEHERVRTRLPVELGKCYTVAVFGGRGVTALALRVLDAADNEVTRSEEGTPQAATQLCSHVTASYSVEAEAQSGHGHATLLVYRADIEVAGGEPGLWLGEAAAMSAKSRH